MKKFIVIFIFLLVVGCTKTSNQEMNPNTVLARVEGEDIKWKDVEGELGTQLAYMDQKYQESVYNTKKQYLERYIGDFLLKKESEKEKITSEELLNRETSQGTTISDKEAEDFFKQNEPFLKSRFPNDKKPDLISKIKVGLGNQRKAQAHQDYVERLKEKYKVELLIKAPRIEVSADDDPYLGNKNAKVTIIEFSDFTCPYCSQAAKTVRTVMSDPKYQNNVKLVYRDSPTDRRPASFPAALAAQCAFEQNKFWEYHDMVFENQARLSIDVLKELAQGVSVDMNQFNACFDTKKYENEVNKDLRDGFKAGISGTPTFFVNGKMAQIPPGDAGVQALKKLIDEEL